MLESQTTTNVNIYHVGDESKLQDHSYFPTYNSGCENYSNYSWNYAQCDYFQPEFQEDSKLEELLIQYMSSQQAENEELKASIQNLEMQIEQLTNMIYSTPQVALLSNSEENIMEGVQETNLTDGQELLTYNEQGEDHDFNYVQEEEGTFHDQNKIESTQGVSDLNPYLVNPYDPLLGFDVGLFPNELNFDIDNHAQEFLHQNLLEESLVQSDKLYLKDVGSEWVDMNQFFDQTQSPTTRDSKTEWVDMNQFFDPVDIASKLYSKDKIRSLKMKKSPKQSSSP